MVDVMAVKKVPAGLRSTDRIEPFAYFEALRAAGNVLWDESMRAWIVLDFDTCRFVEDNEDRFPNAYRIPNPLFNEIKGGENISSMQDEAHHRMRHFHLQLLSPVAVKGYREDFIAPILDALIAPILAAGSGDLTRDLGDQLPPRLSAAFFGMPWDDNAVVSDLLRLNGIVMNWIGMRAAGDKVLEDKARAASIELNAMIQPFVERSRREPGSDFVSRAIAEAPKFYPDLTDQDIIAMCRELLLAGSDTTTHAIANAFYLLLTDADVRAEVERDPDGTIDALIEEALRIYGSVQYQVRYAAGDTELGGQAIRRGDAIILHHAAANRDAATYPDPAAVDFGRPALKRHLAFGIGPRACPGAALARAEMRETIKLVLVRLPGVRLDLTAEQPRFDGFYTRSWRPLNVVFDRG